MEDYILTGLQFSDCQKETLKSFSANDDKSSSNPCVELKNVVEKCANIVQVSNFSKNLSQIGSNLTNIETFYNPKQSFKAQF